MTVTIRLSAVHPTPTGVIRAVQERLDALERDVRAARDALAAAEAELLAAQGMSETQPDALTTDQVARLLGLSRSTVTTMIGRGQLVSVKIGGARRVLRRSASAAPRPGRLPRLARLWRRGMNKTADGRSSIHRCSDGNGWEGWTPFGTDPRTGKRRRTHVRGRTKAEVEVEVEVEVDGKIKALETARQGTLATGPDIAIRLSPPVGQRSEGAEVLTAERAWTDLWQRGA